MAPGAGGYHPTPDTAWAVPEFHFGLSLVATVPAPIKSPGFTLVGYSLLVSRLEGVLIRMFASDKPCEAETRPHGVHEVIRVLFLP